MKALGKHFRLLSVAMLMVMLFSTVAMAAIPSNTVIIGNNAYDLSLLNDPGMTTEILNSFINNNNNLIYKDPSGKLVNSNAQTVSSDSLPSVFYKDKDKQQKPFLFCKIFHELFYRRFGVFGFLEAAFRSSRTARASAPRSLHWHQSSPPFSRSISASETFCCEV